MATLLYFAGPDITVVVLENDDARNGVEDMDGLARRLAGLALGEPYPTPTPVAVDASTLAAAEGSLPIRQRRRPRLAHCGWCADRQRGDGARRVLTPIAADDFIYEDGFNRIVLERDAGGAITGARFFASGDGAGERGIRSNEPLPQAPTGLQLPPAALERLVGEYDNNQVSLRIFLDAGALKAQIPGQHALALFATSETHFQVAEQDATLEFPAWRHTGK